jgi:hypothetical protein
MGAAESENRQDAKVAKELGREETSAALDALVQRVMRAP